MSDVVSALSDGVFALLDAAAIGIPVATNLPEDTQPPFITFNDIDASLADEKSIDDWRVSIEVVVVYRGRDRSALHALMKAVLEAVHGQSPITDDVHFSPLRCTRSASSGPGEDGVTHAGILEFQGLAQAL